MKDKFLRLPAVKEITGRSRSSIYADMETGDFPKSIKTGPQSIAWLESELEAWMDDRIEKSRGARSG